jgi:hypothetical protein
MAIRTIFSMAEDCVRGERLGWTEFVRDYAGIARFLLERYFPVLIPDVDHHVAAVFRRADAANEAWFAGLKFTNEREFMMAFRDLIFAYGREQARVPAPQITLDEVRAAMKDLNVLERELLWLIIKGYDAQRIAAMMMNAAATAEAVQRLARERLPALLSGTAPQVLADYARVLIELAEQSKTDQCLALKTFNNLVNGQISWRERELAEEHMSNCFYCIDRFTTFQEMIRLRKDVPELPATDVAAILAQLTCGAGKPGGVLSRLFASR